MHDQSTLPSLPQQPDGVEIRWIPGFTGYAITSNADLYSFWISVRDRKRLVDRPKKRKVSRNSGGYLATRLPHDDGTVKSVAVHRLVLAAFRGIRLPGMVARHLNGNQLDNRLENLAWGTQKENVDDAKRHGTASKGEKIYSAVLKEYQVAQIKKAMAGTTNSALCRKIADFYGVTESAIYYIASGRTWTHVNPSEIDSLSRRINGIQKEFARQEKE